MKEKILMIILTLFLAITMNACGMKPKTENSIKEVEPTLSEEIQTSEPNSTIEPTESDNSSISTDENNNIDEITNETEDKSEDTSNMGNTEGTENVDSTIEGDVFTNPVVLSTPPFNYYLSENASNKKSEPKNLEITSSKTNQITDEAEWLLNNNLSMNTYQIPNTSQNSGEILPEGIDESFDELIITKAFYDDSYIYSTYGADFSEGYILNIYDIKSLALIATFDFSNYRYSPDFILEDYDFIQQKINWAILKDNILYVSHSHMTYAKSSNNMNAYITAIDLTDMSILWRTDALVSNSNNFLIMDDVIISGYGFTEEDDYLYQISINNGEILDKISLASSPYYLIKRENILYVRTYNTDYELNIVQ